MLDIQYIILIILAFVLMYMGIEFEREHDYWNIVMIFLSSIIFFALTFGTLNIEQPWQMYNLSSEQIETGYQVYGMEYSLMYLWFLFAMVNWFYGFFLMFKPFFQKHGWVK